MDSTTFENQHGTTSTIKSEMKFSLSKYFRPISDSYESESFHVKRSRPLRDQYLIFQLTQ